jgi:hypothetical protein
VRELPKLPRKIKGSVIDYTVSIGTADVTMAGECVLTVDGAELRVSNAYPIEYQWQTLFHELVHKWEREGGIKLKDEDDNSEVDRLATAIFADFIRNGWPLPGE